MIGKSTFLPILFCLTILESNGQTPSYVKVTGFENISRGDTSDKRLYRRDYIRLTVDSLPWLIKNKPQNEKIILFIDGIPFDDLEHEFIDRSTVIFRFQKNIETNAQPESKAWTYFYKKPRRWTMPDKTISIGYEDHEPVASTARIDLVIIHGLLYKIGIGIIIALLFALVALAIKTNLLRDNSPVRTKKRPFSLARTQFAFWLFLIASGYIFLWISTGEMPQLTNSSLILIGISGTTSIIAKVIENSQALNLSGERTSENFFVDLLSDDQGISLHRLQMLVFTVVIGVIFIHDVMVVFEMPEFDDNLLLLMGISNGTYAGFKTTENATSVPVG